MRVLQTQWARRVPDHPRYELRILQIKLLFEIHLFLATRKIRFYLMMKQVDLFYKCFLNWKQLRSARANFVLKLNITKKGIIHQFDHESIDGALSHAHKLLERLVARTWIPKTQFQKVLALFGVLFCIPMVRPNLLGRNLFRPF